MSITSHRIRKVNAVTGIMTTVAGTRVGGYSGGGGVATSAQLAAPTGAAYAATGELNLANAFYYDNRVIGVYLYYSARGRTADAVSRK